MEAGSQHMKLYLHAERIRGDGVTYDPFSVISNVLIIADNISNTCETDLMCLHVYNEHAGNVLCCSVHVKVRILPIIHSSTPQQNAHDRGIKEKAACWCGNWNKA